MAVSKNICITANVSRKAHYHLHYDHAADQLFSWSVLEYNYAS